MASLKGIGANDKQKIAILSALGVVLLVLAFRTIFGGSSGAPPVLPPQAAGGPTVGSAARTVSLRNAPAGSATLILPSGEAALDPRLHPELMAENENYLYKGLGRNIFSRDSVAPTAMESAKFEKVKGPIRPALQNVAANAGPPQPPAVELRFFGYTARHDGVRHAFLIHGDDVFVAAEGDVVSHRYRVVKIGPLSVQIEDLPYHDTQTLQLSQN